jgi:hypothetical protein
MQALRCLGLGCEYLQPAAREEYAGDLLSGFCLCRQALERADRRRRLRAAGKLRDRGLLVSPAPGVPGRRGRGVLA